MNLESTTNTHSQYISRLRDYLPDSAFKNRPRKLYICAIHLVVILTGYYGIHKNQLLILNFLIAIMIGHSLACIAFLSHELSHGSILKNSKLRYFLEVALWGLNIIPATLWKRLHNHSHHKFGSTLKDPDRFFTKTELDDPKKGRIRMAYVKLFYPHANNTYLNPLVWLHFITYILRHLLAFLYPGETKPPIVTYKPLYTTRQKIHIFFEIIIIAFIQWLIFITLGGWSQYLYASPIAIMFTSTFVMAYIWTNHYLHGLESYHDPIKSSTSVVVPSFFDKLHSNFSFHTEHHLFPSLNSDYYPTLSKALQKEYPDIYNRLPITSAWSRLFKINPYVAVTSEPLSDPGPKKERSKG